ncbi:Microtubule-nucleating Tub4p (gamma-tubulin) complex component [Coemansia sp. RSA 552]|nr:Microtubule-nucleating Tub4p (gamma-tubulin) complex component [Coemansia sp. RSA 552]
MESTELGKTLAKYIDSFLPPANADDHEEQSRRSDLARYFHSIIDSSIAPTMPRDEETMVADMLKRAASGGRNARQSLHISRLYALLKQQSPTHDWWPVLYLLSESSRSSTTNAPTSAAPSSYFAERRPQEPSVPLRTSSFPPLPPQPQSLQRGGTSLAYPMRPGATSALPRGVSDLAGYDSVAAPQPQQRVPADSVVADRQVPREDEGVFLHRELPTYDDITEAELLQDLIFVIQGIEGKYIKWNPRMGVYVVQPGINLSRPTREMAIAISELGCMTQDIQSHIEAVARDGLLFDQSLCVELKAEMSDYYKLVSDIEGRLFKAPRTLRPGESQLGVTLRRMFQWTMEARKKLRLMSTVITKVKDGLVGGSVLSTISTMVDDGDPFVQSFARRLLKTASVPFNNVLVSWVTNGELEDPYNEFFIRENKEHREMLWADKYKVDQDMIPVHLNPRMARDIYQIGLSLNFLCEICDDAQWVREDGPRTLLAGKDISDPATLDSFVHNSSRMTNRRLMDVLRDKFDLMGHIEAIRSYLLFEQGDFAVALMEVLDDHINRGSRRVMGHDLSAALASAVRSSNAQYENPDHLELMKLAFDSDLSSGPQQPRQDKGWEDIELRYDLAQPLSHIIARGTMRKYREISRFLLRLKRVECSLTMIWRKQMTEARSHQRSEELKRRRRSGDKDVGAAAEQGSTNAVRQAMRQSAIACSEMLQFFHQIQRYVSFNVIEGSWRQFLSRTSNDDIDIDRWNSAHSLYVSSVHDVVCGNAVGFQRLLGDIFATVSQFITAVRELYSEQALSARQPAAPTPPVSSSSATPAGSRGSIADRLQRLRSGSGILSSTEPSPSSDRSGERASQVHTTATRFREQVEVVLSVLTHHHERNRLSELTAGINFNFKYLASDNRRAP